MPWLLMPWLLVLQIISSHDNDYIKQACHCLPWVRISTSCFNSVSRIYRKCKYMFPKTNSARQGLGLCMSLYGGLWTPHICVLECWEIRQRKKHERLTHETTHWGWNKMAHILPAKFSNAFSRMKMIILIKIWLQIVPKGPIDKKSSLF